MKEQEPMHVASLELCKTLYELSGWKVVGRHIDQKETYPAYDLGYLLRKLPAAITPSLHGKKVAIKDNKTYFFFVQRTPDHYVASYNVIGNTLEFLHFKSADTPEDAAAKLCIELFKAGILTRESNDD